MCYMAIDKSKRDEYKEPNFVKQAARVDSVTGRMCARLPKRWGRTRTSYITDYGNKLLEYAISANTIYPKTPEELNLRTIHLKNAVIVCNILISKINRIDEEKPTRIVTRHVGPDEERSMVKQCLSDAQIIEWTREIIEARKLLNGVLKSDRSRFRRSGDLIVDKKSSRYNRYGLRKAHRYQAVG